MNVLVCATIAGVFTMLGCGFLYMLTKDLGLEYECRGFISLIDRLIATLKRLVNSLYQCYTHKDNKNQADKRHNNSNRDTNPNIVFRKILNLINHRPNTK